MRREQASASKSEVRMPSINISPAPVGDVISTIGTDEVYVELSYRRLGAVIQLTATMVEYNAFNGRYLRDELGVEIADDEEDAIGAAEDLEWLAVQQLDARGPRGYKSPCGFAEAVERLLNTNTEADREYLQTAIAANAALIAAE
jgi:hypothetical protein